jgi:hypothetical protein
LSIVDRQIYWGVTERGSVEIWIVLHLLLLLLKMKNLIDLDITTPIDSKKAI